MSPRPYLRAEPSERSGRMIIRFVEYDPDIKRRVAKLPGARFVGPTQPEGPAFRIQWDMQTCDDLMKEFGSKIQFSEEVIKWGREERARAAALTALGAQAEATEGFSFDVLEQKLSGRRFYDKNTGQMRDLWEAFRPDQRLGVEWLSKAQNPLLADEAGLGKTWQVVGSMMLDGAEQGYNLIICPKISIENVWLQELNLFQDELVFVAPEGRKQREKLLEEVALCLEDEIPFWLVVNPAMVSLRRTKKRDQADLFDHVSGSALSIQFPFLFEVEWDTIVIDETQDSGIANPSSQFSRALKMMTSKRRIGLSGTPMGG
ncbi:MAG: hypothetical protein GTO63_25485, partial [Anaerolineae bacterium]|nr:hypothetical protein [Anaerolineae bacterium]NIN98082.1 hypothetical protein [Anaerolineae bacterium]